MTHVSYEDPSSLRTLLACTIVVLLLLRRKNKQRSNPLMNDDKRRKNDPNFWGSVEAQLKHKCRISAGNAR